eukprot:3018529-Prymnesium_polylepis.1
MSCTRRRPSAQQDDDFDHDDSITVITNGLQPTRSPPARAACDAYGDSAFQTPPSKPTYTSPRPKKEPSPKHSPRELLASLSPALTREPKSCYRHLMHEPLHEGGDSDDESNLSYL